MKEQPSGFHSMCTKNIMNIIEVAIGLVLIKRFYDDGSSAEGFYTQNLFQGADISEVVVVCRSLSTDCILTSTS